MKIRRSLFTFLSLAAFCSAQAPDPEQILSIHDTEATFREALWTKYPKTRLFVEVLTFDPKGTASYLAVISTPWKGHGIVQACFGADFLKELAALRRRHGGNEYFQALPWDRLTLEEKWLPKKAALKLVENFYLAQDHTVRAIDEKAVNESRQEGSSFLLGRPRFRFRSGTSDNASIVESDGADSHLTQWLSGVRKHYPATGSCRGF